MSESGYHFNCRCDFSGVERVLGGIRWTMNMIMVDSLLKLTIEREQYEQSAQLRDRLIYMESSNW